MRRLLLALVALAVAVPAAGAHPLGNFTVNQYARIQVAPAGVDVHFVLDQAEIPTLQMVQAHDSNGSGKLEGAELTAVRDQLVRDITGHIALTMAGRPVRLAVTGATLALPKGQGGLATTMELTAARRPFLYFPLGHHFEQRFHVRHRLDRYGAGRCMDFETASPDAIGAAIAEEIGREVAYRDVENDGAARAAALIAEVL